MYPTRRYSRGDLRPRTIALALVAVVLAGCGDDKPSSSTSSRNSAPTVSAATTTTVADTTTTDTTVAPDPANADITLDAWATELDSPVAFAPRPDSDLIYVAEQYAGVRIVQADGTLGELALDLAGTVSTGNEQGVLGLAFSPDGSKLYVDTTGTDNHTRVTEYAMEGDAIDASSAREVLFVEQPFSNHNGGDLKFGPDGMLYVALGDGGAGGDPLGSGQDVESLLGKILRIDPNSSGGAAYAVPSDNPFVDGDGADEVWAYGLRNPWRFSFDRLTGDLWIGDVGQNAYEEISFGPAGVGGRNYGWNAREGLHEYEGGEMPPGAVDPVIELSHGDGNCSITGGFVYRGAAIPALVGSYVFGDFCKGDLIALDADHAPIALDLNVSQLSSFGEDNEGELYAISREGTIWKITNA
jgi:glucose/arabinose dehydrogenase